MYSADVPNKGWQRRYDRTPMNRNQFNFDHKNSFIDPQSIHTMSPIISQPQHQQQLPHADEDLAYRGHAAMAGYDGV